MVRMLGAPTFFFTLSAADTKWADIIGKCWSREHGGRKPTAEDLANLKPGDRSRLLRKHPAIAAEGFHDRVVKLFGLLLDDEGTLPLGPIYDLY